MEVTTALQLARKLLEEHGLNGWRVHLSRSVRRLGFCDYTDRVIGLSRHHIEHGAEAEVRDTILHEIAHALTPGDAHGTRWQAKCVEIGAAPRRTIDSASVTMPDPAYRLVCPNCGYAIGYYRRPRKRWWCKTCVDNGVKGLGPMKLVAYAKSGRWSR